MNAGDILKAQLKQSSFECQIQIQTRVADPSNIKCIWCASDKE